MLSSLLSANRWNSCSHVKIIAIFRLTAKYGNLVRERVGGSDRDAARRPRDRDHRRRREKSRSPPPPTRRSPASRSPPPNKRPKGYRHYILQTDIIKEVSQILPPTNACCNIQAPKVRWIAKSCVRSESSVNERLWEWWARDACLRVINDDMSCTLCIYTFWHRSREQWSSTITPA